MKKLKVTAIIPSRMGSSRYPGKPLAPILGLPMIEHVRRRALLMPFLDNVFVATCDEEIKDLVTKNDGNVIMTSSKHERCTDRIHEAASEIDADIIVNIQGDEPMVLSHSIEEVIKPFYTEENISSTCVVYPISNPNDYNSKDIVKAVLSKSKRILYLSRSCIPGNHINSKITYYKQSGIMAFTKKFLKTFSDLEPQGLETQESIDMLRVLEHDFKIDGVICATETKGVDLPEHIPVIEKELKSNIHQMEILDKIKRM